MRPDDVDRAEQLAFLARVLPAPRAKILDAGCGRGELAAQLLDRGFEVTAVDIDPDDVDAARRLGVPAVVGDFLRFEDGPFDVVLFSRSLHHISPLDEAVARAYSFLEPDGLLIADEFAVDRADRPTAGWFYDMMTLLEEAGALHPSERVPPPSDDPLERWMLHHQEDPPLHTGGEMTEAVRSRFDLVSIESAAYLFGYLGDWLEESERGHRLARLLHEMESNRIADGTLTAVGLRIVARRP